VTTNVGGAAVELVLSNVEDAPDPVAAGAVVTYTIVVANAGTSAANGLDITQVFDDLTGMTFETAVGSQGFTCSFSSPTVTCTGNLLAGQTTVLTVRFDTTAAAVPSVSSEITVDSNNEFTEADESNNIDTEVTTISADICQNCIDLVMGPLFVNPDPVANGDDVTVNFDVTNVGDLSTAADADAGSDEVVIQIDVDGIFNEYSAITASIPGFTCVVTSHAGDFGNAAPEVTCTKMAGLAPGEGALASIVITADTGSDPSLLFFDVVADPSPPNLVSEFNEANNTASTTLTVDTPPPGP